MSSLEIDEKPLEEQGMFIDDDEWEKEMGRDPKFGGLPMAPKTNDGEIETSLEDLTFDQIVSTFTDNYQDVHFTRKQPNGEEGNYYRDSISFPNFDDSLTSIGDENAWEDW